MSQITSGFRSILSSPFVYSTLQMLMGAHSGRTAFVRDFVRPQAGMNVLDIGCGPADILSYLPDVNYWGFDISRPYIDMAIKKYGKRGYFYTKILKIDELENMPQFDIVIASGLLHHMDDIVANELFTLAHAALKKGGRLVTIDPCWEPGQNPVAKFLISKDRGQSVRDRYGYSNLASKTFDALNVEVRHRAWIPYTHCIMECTRT